MRQLIARSILSSTAHHQIFLAHHPTMTSCVVIVLSVPLRFSWGCQAQKIRTVLRPIVPLIAPIPAASRAHSCQPALRSRNARWSWHPACWFDSTRAPACSASRHRAPRALRRSSPAPAAEQSRAAAEQQPTDPLACAYALRCRRWRCAIHAACGVGTHDPRRLRGAPCAGSSRRGTALGCVLRRRGRGDVLARKAVDLLCKPKKRKACGRGRNLAVVRTFFSFL